MNKMPIGVNAGDDCVTLRYGSIKSYQKLFCNDVVAGTDLSLTFRFHFTIVPENLFLKA